MEGMIPVIIMASASLIGAAIALWIREH